MNIIVVSVLSLLVTFAPLLQEDKRDFLDLTKPKPEDKAKTSSGVGIAGGGSGTRRLDLPLRMRILNFEQQGKYFGDKIFYEVSIENISDTNLLIPWTADLLECSENPARSLLERMDMSLVLVWQDTAAGDAWITFSGSYGCVNDPKTFRMLHPGERIKVRAGGSTYVIDANERAPLAPLLPRTFTVKARLSLSHSAVKGVQFRPALSENSFIVEFKKRQ